MTSELRCCLPLLIADAVILHAVGFSISHHLAGLLWTQVLLTMAFVLPAATFAVMTSGLGELLIATLLIVVGILIWLTTGLLMHGGSPWFELEWVRTYCLMAELAAAAAIVVLWQYARRNTLITRLAAVVAVIVLLASHSRLPWTSAFALQTHLSHWESIPAPFASNWIQIENG